MESIFPGFTGDTHRAVLSHDWSWLALTYASNTNQVVLHNLRDGAVGRSVAEDEDEDESPVRKNFSDYAILGAAYVGSNIIIRSGSDAGAVLWDTDAGRSIKRIAHREYVVRIAFSPNGEMIAVLSESSDVWVLDAKTLTQVKSFRMTYGRARGGGVFFSSDSELLAAYNGGSARIWTLNVKGLPFSYFTRGISEEGWVKLCAISPDNVRVAGVHHGKILHVWQIGVHDKVGVQATIPSYYIEEKELSAAFSPSDPSLLAFHRRSSITLWRVSEELQLIIELSVDKQFHNGFSFSSDGKFLAYGPVCWHIVNPVEPLPYYGVSPPISFITSGLHSHSFLFYEDGWIYKSLCLIGDAANAAKLAPHHDCNLSLIMKAIFSIAKKKKKPGVSTPTALSGPPISTEEDTKRKTGVHWGPSAAYKDSSEIAEHFLGVVKEISEATDVLSPLKSACAVLLRGIHTMRTIRNNQMFWADLCEELERNLEQMEVHRDDLQSGPTVDNYDCLRALENYISIIAKIIDTALKHSAAENRRIISRIGRSGTVDVEKEDIRRSREMLEIAWQSYSLSMKSLLKLKVGTIEDLMREQEVAHVRGVSIRRAQDDYGVMGSDYAVAYGERLEVCEQGTRVKILDEIRKWADNTETSKQIFWLSDAAGTGKSTVAATMAKEWSLGGQLAGRFFFSPNSTTTQTTKGFCLAVARDIVTNQPMLAEVILDVINTTPLDQPSSFETQIQQLIVNPLRNHKANKCLLLAVDALDNCVLEEERSGLLNGLIKYLPSVRYLRVLLTTRPYQDIVDILESSPLVQSTDTQLLNIRHSYHHDINVYVEKRLGNISTISSDQRKMIVAMSGGLFLFAATVCRMLERGRHPNDIVKILSNIGVTERLERKMDILYLAALNRALVDRSANKLMMNVLSLIIIAYQPLSINTLRRFLSDSVHVEDFVQDLSSVLKDGNPDRPIKVLHPTFREFVLSNEDRANGFLINPITSSTVMAIACIDTLEHFLHEDMLQLTDGVQKPVLNSDVVGIAHLVDTHTTAAERYASAFWAHHVAASEVDQQLLSRWQPEITTSYVSEWDGDTSVGKHSGSVYNLLFSPAGTHVISVGSDGLLQLWHGETGALVGKPFQGWPSRLVSSITNCTFSADGTRFSFLSSRRELHIRFSQTNEAIIPPVEGYLKYAFTPGMTHMLSVVGSTVQLSNIDRGSETSPARHIGTLPDGFKAQNIAISPKIQMIVCVGEFQPSTGTADIFLWELATFKQISNHRLNTMYTSLSFVYVAFSPDSTRFVTWAENRQLQLFNGQTGDEILQATQEKEYHPYRGLATFCPLSRHFAYTLKGSADVTIRLLVVHHEGGARILDLETGETIWSHLMGKSGDSFELINISPNNMKVACRNKDCRLSVWNLDAPSQAPLVSTIICSGTIGAFSPTDPFLLAIVDPLYCQFDLWRVNEDTQLISRIKLPEHAAGKIVFSLDGQYLAYGQYCWDVLMDPSTLTPYHSLSPPTSFERRGLNTHSFLSYKDGWIYSSYPPGPVLPIPTELRVTHLADKWHVSDEIVILLSRRGTPILINCAATLARARAQEK
ncbi:hypothetical protein FRC17_010217 [Serendipita sp. 399]|nr:hypothetical protein FRC17_010217 [Serendipita sp. 399]